MTLIVNVQNLSIGLKNGKIFKDYKYMNFSKSNL